MPIEIAFLVVAIAAIAITYKTYVGYGDYRWYTKLGCLLFLIGGWCAPFIGFALRHTDLENQFVYLSKILYFWFGLSFFIFAITLVRDIAWTILDVIRRVPISDLKNTALLSKINIGTLIFCLLFCLYGVYEAEKMPAVKTYEISSPKIKEATKIVMLSDLHIDTNVSPKVIKNIVEKVNSLNPDDVVLVGDLVDNEPGKIFAQIEELRQLKPKNKVYFVLGNHEFYNNAREWAMTLSQIGFVFLNNVGENLGNSGIYLAGIPDINAAQMVRMPIKIKNALYNASKDDYVILLSHSPKIAEGVTKENVDLQLSGHTHGAQIYPFHYITEKANDGVLAGFYDKQGVKLYVSRGTRYWGPPIRIFAPSEITVFEFKPEKTQTKEDGSVKKEPQDEKIEKEEINTPSVEETPNQEETKDE